MLLAIGVLFIILVAIRNAQASANLNVDSDNKVQPKEKVALCLTPACVRTAAIFSESMDRNANPCNDFYQYACGNYERKAAIPDDRLFKRRTDEIEEYVKMAIKEILEEPKLVGEMSALRKAKDLYAACMNTSRINDLGTKPLEDLLLLLGEWTGLYNETWHEKIRKFDWDDFMIALDKNGLSNDYILSIQLDVEKLNSTTITVEISPPSLTFPPGYNSDPETIDADRARYLELMKTFGEKMGITREEFGDEFDKVMFFETQLARITSEDTGSRREMSLQEFSKMFTMIDWIGWLQDMVSKNIKASDRVILNMDESTLVKILHVQSVTSERTLHNYMNWRTSLSTIYLLHEDFQQLLFNYESKTFGPEVRPPRWEVCAKVVNVHFKHAIGNVYIQNFLDQKVAPQVMKILKNICDEMKYMIMEAKWMDDQTRTKALEKAHQMKSIIGYSQEILDENVLDEYYKNVDVNPQEYFTSMTSLSKYWPSYDIEKHLRFKKISWSDMQTAAARGDYNAAQNQIEIPAGMLQKLHFDADRPNYINYAMIGYFIGHEIAHGFANTERSIVKDGIVMDWWQPTTAQEFLKRAKCMSDQYEYSTSQLQVNRHKVLQGIIADNGGVKAAYRAYNKLSANNGPETLLPYFSLKAKQLFWTSYANIWCSKQIQSADKQTLENEDQIPARFRVNGVLSNLPEFAEDFKCKAGSPMNPGKKCQVW